MDFSQWMQQVIDQNFSGNVDEFCAAANISRQSAWTYINKTATPVEKTMMRIIEISPKPLPAGVIEDYAERRMSAVTASAGKRRKQDTICWECINAVPDRKGHGCEWSRHFKPVEGWKAEPTRVSFYSGSSSSYAVLECPKYEQDKCCVSDEELLRQKLVEQGIVIPDVVTYKVPSRNAMYKRKYAQKHREEANRKERERYLAKKGMPVPPVEDARKKEYAKAKIAREERRTAFHERQINELKKLAEVSDESVDEPV